MPLHGHREGAARVHTGIGGQLTDDDLVFTEGKEDELLGRLQQRLGQNKEEIRDAIEKL